MPLVGFSPTKARLVIEENKESVLVLKVVVAKEETVELITGGKLESLCGVLRIRERKSDAEPSNGKGIGSLVFVEAAGQAEGHQPAKFQINISMSAKKFDALLRVAMSGRLPSKFFIDAGEKVSRAETKGMTYRMGPEGRTKTWDNKTFRSLMVTNFSMILPITVQEKMPSPTPAPETPILSQLEGSASYEQVVELADDLAVFHSETKHTLMAVVSLIAVMAVLALLFNLALLFK